MKNVLLDLVTAAESVTRFFFATAWRSPWSRRKEKRRKIMCLAIPGKLIEISDDPQGVRMGKANFGGIVKQVCLEYTPEANPGRLCPGPCRFCSRQSR